MQEFIPSKCFCDVIYECPLNSKYVSIFTEPSPKPSESNNLQVVEVAPKKTFKNRYLADEKAKLVRFLNNVPQLFTVGIF